MKFPRLRRAPARRPSRLRRIVVGGVKAVAGVFAASILLTIALRWIRPPFTAIGVERRVEALWKGRAYEPRRQWVPWTDIAPYAPLAVVAAEDQLFAVHHGFDFESIEDALEARERGRRLRGASTISQQVAKNLFLWPGRTFVRKGLEAYFTVLIETLWPKRRILEMYLNIVEFGDGVFGVEAASQRFFRKPASRLGPGEAALLAAVLPNPHRFRADRPSAFIEERRAWILRQMDQIGGVAFVKGL